MVRAIEAGALDGENCGHCERRSASRERDPRTQIAPNRLFRLRRARVAAQRQSRRPDGHE